MNALDTGTSPSQTGTSKKSTGILSAVGQEMKANPPAILNATRRKFGAARASKQRVAILLSKARKAGANIPGRTS